MVKTTLAAFADRFSRAGWGNAHPLTLGRVRTELLSGLTVALALIPEAVAFSFVAGVHPLVGLYAAFIVGLVTAVFGGRPGMISGATGALAVVMVSLVSAHGVEYLFATVVLMGILQLLAGAFRLGKFIRLVPHPVMLGFVNGLAILIFMAQLSQFQVTGADGAVAWMTGAALVRMLSLVVLTMGIIWLTPKVTTAVPAPLVGIGIVAAMVILFGIDVPRVGDLASIQGGLPSFHLPAIAWTFETLEIIFPYAFILAAIGLIESLLTLNLVGEITGERGGASRECLAQGLANTVTGFFGGMGGCAMIGQSMINIKSGGRTRIAGVAAAVFLLTFILVGSDLIERIPLAALVGVMFMVVVGTFAWQSLGILRRIPLTDALVLVLVTVVTVMSDLAIAVVVGVVVSALAFAWNHAQKIHAISRILPDGSKVYQIEGPLFFASTNGFAEVFDPVNDPDLVIVDFINSRVVDQSALQAIEGLASRYESEGKTLQLRHLSHDCHKLLNRAGQLMVDADDDPEYGLAVDYSIRTVSMGAGH
ncbi:MAG: SulP family inorganic anion transporter [Planctomycetes bacterium]|nr:SulP family inorganic anion transporter [Planctomycetota bacterium]